MLTLRCFSIMSLVMPGTSLHKNVAGGGVEGAGRPQHLPSRQHLILARAFGDHRPAKQLKNTNYLLNKVQGGNAALCVGVWSLDGEEVDENAVVRRKATGEKGLSKEHRRVPHTTQPT